MAENIGKTELLIDPGHIRSDLSLMTAAVKRSTECPEIPIPEGVIEAMPKITGKILLSGKDREKLAAGKLLLAFLEYNRSLRPQQPQLTPVVNVGVQIQNHPEATIEQKRSRLAERIARLG